MKKIMKQGFLFVIVLAFLSGLAYSQSRDTGAIEGRVTDNEQNPMPGVEVNLSSPDMIGGDKIKVTDAVGKFRFVGLQPGIYRIACSLQGFADAVREDIVVHIGQTLTVAIEMVIGTLEEEVTVIGIAPLIDVKDSSMGASFLETEFLENIPDRRRRTSYMIDYAPGVVGHGAFGGQGRSANSYTLDGMETDYPESGSCWSMVDFNVFEEVQVMGLGAGAEYDGFQGAVMNTVSKSGGNEFEGHLEFFFVGWGFQETDHIDMSDPFFGRIGTPSQQREIDFGFSLGGPIIKDKLWFFGAGRYREMDRKIADMPELFILYLPKGFLKFTLQAGINDRLSSFFEYDLYYNPRTDLSPFRPPEAATIEWGPVYMFSLMDLHTFSDRTFMEIKLAGYLAPYSNKVRSGMDTPGRHNDQTGMYSVNASSYSFSGADRYTAYATLSHHADEFIIGSHDFKFGVEYELSPAFYERGLPGDFRYVDYVVGDDGEYHTYAYSSYSSDDKRFTRISGFFQDNWKISDRLFINPGFRYSIYRGYLKSVGQTVFKASSFTPRIGFTWDIFGDHTTAFKAHYGRYAAGMKHNYYEDASAGIEDSVMYDVLPDGTKNEVYRVNYSNPSTIDPNIKYPIMDQISVGIEREVWKDASFGATFIWRKWDNFIARVSTETTWDPVPFTFTDDKGAQQTITVYNKVGSDVFYVTNPKKGEHSVIVEPKSKYVGLMLTFNKRFSNNWMLNASYILCQLKGTEQGGSSKNSAYRDPNRQINTYGRLSGDRTHQIKIYATFVLPLDIRFSPGFNYITGGAETREVRATAVSGNPTVFIDGRGGWMRYPGTINLDLRLEKFFKIGGGRLGVMLDAMNALNRGVESGVEERVDRSYFGLATGVNAGRLIRVGVRYLF